MYVCVVFAAYSARVCSACVVAYPHFAASTIHACHTLAHMLFRFSSRQPILVLWMRVCVVVIVVVVRWQQNAVYVRVVNARGSIATRLCVCVLVNVACASRYYSDDSKQRI